MFSFPMQMFRRSNNLSDPNASLNVLKDRVCFAVEQGVQSELKDFDVSDELYIEMSFKHWERFYSCCEQYHIKSTQPVGLLLLDSVGAVAIVKKNTFSLLRPCELLEHLMLVGGSIEVDAIDQFEINHDMQNCNVDDLEILVSILSTIEQQLSDDEKNEIDEKLYNLSIPNVVVSELVSNILSGDDYGQMLNRQSVQSISKEIKPISNLPNVVISLLKILRLDEDQADEPMTFESERSALACGEPCDCNNLLLFDCLVVRGISFVAFTALHQSTVPQQCRDFGVGRNVAPNLNHPLFDLSQPLDSGAHSDGFE